MREGDGEGELETLISWERPKTSWAVKIVREKREERRRIFSLLPFSLFFIF